MMQHLTPGDKRFLVGDTLECILSFARDGTIRLIVYHMQRLVFTSRFGGELLARQFAMTYKPPPPPTKRRRRQPQFFVPAMAA